MLVVVVIGFERSEVDTEFGWDIGLKNCALRIHLKDGHVLSVEVLSFLCDPSEIEFALKFVGD